MYVCVSDWSTRVKQIAKLWRKASSQDRAPFVVSFLSLVEVFCDIQALICKDVMISKKSISWSCVISTDVERDAVSPDDTTKGEHV